MMAATRSKITPAARDRLQRKTRREELAEALDLSRKAKGPAPDYPEPDGEPLKRLT